MTPCETGETLDEGLVSCVMVTLALPERLRFARDSVAAYCRQTYAHKELIVVPNGGTATSRRAVVDMLDGLGRSDVRVVQPSGELTLGALRNLSVAAAAGRFFCQWDDDDLHHPERLQRQINALLAGRHEALLLSEVLQYFPRSGALYWTNWRAAPAGGHPATLIARRDLGIRYPESGASSRLGEDLAVTLGLRDAGRIGYLSDMPHLFIYVSHGANSWNDAHHSRLAHDLGISAGLLRRRAARIRGMLEPFGFAPGAVRVFSPGGLAFVV